MVEIANGSQIMVRKGTPTFATTPADETNEARDIRLLTGYRATGMTYTDVDNVIAIPEFGGTRSTITFNSVSHGVTQKSGNIARVSATFDVADNFDDAGQTILREAFRDNTEITVLVNLTSGTEAYCVGTVAKSTPSGNFDGAVQRQYTINVQGDVTEAKAV